MSLVIALPLAERPKNSRLAQAEKGLGARRAESSRPTAGDALRRARSAFESWLRNTLRLAGDGAWGAGGLDFPRAAIEAELAGSQFGAAGIEARPLYGELAYHLARLDALAGTRRRPSAAFGDLRNRVVDAALEILSLFSALEAERAALMAALDPLTGLGGRRALEDCLQQEWSRMQREGRPCAVALLDIDRFKEINDRHGHLSGDQVLTRFAALLRANLRSYDGVFRYGGEEFVLCLPGVHAPVAKRPVDRIREAAGRAAFATATGKPLRISFSAGVAELAAAASPTQTLEFADGALYRAKAEGRNRVYLAAAAAQSEQPAG